MINQFPNSAPGKHGWPWIAEGIGLYDESVAWPKISIVTPSFNQGRYIEETIRSVLLQNYPNLEYIIIDGGSTDETISIIKKYEPWITYWVTEADRGQSHAINKGLDKTTGRIFNWLNSDDYYYPDTFYQVASAFTANPTVTVVSGFERHLQLDGGAQMHKGTFIAATVLQTIEFAEMAQPSTFFLAGCFKKIGGVNEQLHYIMDGELWVKYLLMYGQDSFYKIDKPLINFRKHGDSKTFQSSIVYHFLYERSSIIVDLQRFAGVPAKIVNYWISEVLNTPQVYNLDIDWKLNKNFVTKRSLKLYFIKKFILLQFRSNLRGDAYWGTMQLLKHYCFDLFTAASIVKLMIKKKH